MVSNTCGNYDSGFIQALDCSGDGPRIPLLAVSPFSRGGHTHSYGDHASLVKFIERNLGPFASFRPQPRQSAQSCDWG